MDRAMEIRDEVLAEHAAIRRLHLGAFPSAQEADLVERLRADGDAVISLVAIEGAELVGHVMFSRMSAPFEALGLAPVAVLPEHRRRGIARHLIEAGIERARNAAWAGIFVVGDPSYYRRFGFEASLASGFESPYAGPYLMALALQAEGFPVRSGRVDYARAFSALA